MTMLLTSTSPHGLLAAADTRLTWADERVEHGRRKIVSWPEMRACVGFAGLATLRGGFTDDVIERLTRPQVLISALEEQSWFFSGRDVASASTSSSVATSSHSAKD